MEVFNPSAKRNAVDSAYIRQQVSKETITSILAVTMAGYQDLSDFQRGLIVGAREMGRSISNKFGFSPARPFQGYNYVNILSNHLHPFMSYVPSDGRGQFEKNNVPLHRSAVATEWLEEHSSEFRPLCLPPNSPNMNIIQHIWNALQHAVLRRSSTPSTP
ncbi:transposable element Tcb2 transposase [Trichonephila clavipes]|nr:transposable element Tcb2 transposase [Trichonephila clavipes]